MRPHLPAALLLVAVLSGCGERGSDAGEPTGGDVPTTPRALAWIATRTLPEPDRASRADDLEELGRATVGFEMRYGSDGEDDGDLVTLGVSERLPRDLRGCASAEQSDGCVTTDEGAVLRWDELEPEEDPGTIVVVVPRGRGGVVMFQAGQAITRDPRALDLRVSVADMIALGQDPRVAPTTTQEAVDGGEDLSFWVDY